ncbi:MAG: NAD(P)H-binding protein [candidate division Zixibacteria bacterium]
MADRAIIVGGTGLLGLPVALQLKADRFEVAIMSTNPVRARKELGDSFEIVEGDVTQPDTLLTALTDCRYVHLNLNAHTDPDLYRRIEIEGSQNVATVARANGVKRISMISGASSRGEEKGVIFLDAKVRAERALIESGVPYTIFRPSWFFETLSSFVIDGQATIIGNHTIPRRWLAAADYARQVSNGLRHPEAANRSFYSLGPEPMTIQDAVVAYAKSCTEKVKIKNLSISEARTLYSGENAQPMNRAIDFYEYMESMDEDVSSVEADDLIGPNLTTLQTWIATHSDK